MELRARIKRNVAYIPLLVSLSKCCAVGNPNSFEIRFLCLFGKFCPHDLCPWVFHEWFMSNSWVDHEWVSGAVSAGSEIQKSENHQNSIVFDYFWLAGQRPGTRSRTGIWRQLDWHPAHQHRAHKREKPSSQNKKQKRFDIAR